jgi:hypothetical protein
MWTTIAIESWVVAMVVAFPAARIIFKEWACQRFGHKTRPEVLIWTFADGTTRTANCLRCRRCQICLPVPEPTP